MSARRRLGLALDSMWSIKDYALSGALQRFAVDNDLTTWIPAALLDDTRALVAQLDISHIEMRPALPQNPGRLVSLAGTLQKTLLYERCDVGTERVMRLREASPSVRSRSGFERVAGNALRALAKSPLSRPTEKLLGKVRRGLTSTADYDAELQRTGIDALLITDPVRRDFDALIYAAHRRGLPVAASVLSWDNVTAKGRLDDEYRQIMVWNALMREEVLQLYPHFRPDQVIVTGFPRFDIYRRPLPEPFTRVPFLRSLGLDPDRPVVLFANGATRSFRTQPEVIEHLCAALTNGELPGRPQLLIRCHPHDEVATYARFRDLPDVVVWPNPDRVRGSTLYQQVPVADELLTLAASIVHSCACVNPGSTVMLDAALADVPIVCVAYDGNQQLPFWQSYRSSYEYTHQKSFHRHEATAICYSREELIGAVRAAIEDPQARAAQRAHVAGLYLGGKLSSISRMHESIEHLFRPASPGTR